MSATEQISVYDNVSAIESLLLGEPGDQQIISELQTTDWTLAMRRFKWQYYVLDVVRRAWFSMSLEGRLVAYLFATMAMEQDGMLAD